MAYRYDEDLEFLHSMESKDLDVLVKILTKANTERLSKQWSYKAYQPDHSRYVYEIIEELQLFGGNTFANIFRRFGDGVLYREILYDVCDKIKVTYDKNSPVERIEGALLLKFLKQAIDEMTEKELRDLLKDTNINTANGFSRQAVFAAIQSAILAGGFMSYQIALIVANIVAMQTIGSGLGIATSIGLTRAISIFAGPIIAIITGLWTAYNIAGPAYRVTIPAVIQVAYLRLRYKNTFNVFLTGEPTVGKDTIFHILKDGKFVKTSDSTSKIHKETLDTCEKVLRMVNTGGARKNDEENIEARNELESGTQYIYVFRADYYLTNADFKEQVELDLENDKVFCKEKDCTLKIIGTHKDKCLESGIISEDDIQKLVDWLGENGKFKCQILDLTQFNGKEKQQELCDFIID